MLNIINNFNKNAVHKKQTQLTLLTTIEAFKETLQLNERKKLNISIAIDTSQSMLESICGSGVNTMYYTKPLNIESNKITISKMDQAKQAAIKAIENLLPGDIVSIVGFNSIVTIKQPAIEISESNKSDIIKKIQTLTASGMTNLHGGWLSSVHEVTKNLSTNSINRVIILTDGQTNVGIQDPLQISKDVEKIAEASINTTTFGIGADFNEDLLQKIANVGGGTFYYVDDSKKLLEMFSSEFMSLSNICVTDLKIEFQLQNAHISKQWNDLEQVNETFNIGSMSHNNKVNYLFTIDIEKISSNKMYNLGKIIVTYKDESDIFKTQFYDLILPVIPLKVWYSSLENNEIKIQEALLDIAANKTKATQALSVGNLAQAKSLLKSSLDYANTRGINDDRLLNESNILTNTLSMADTTNISSLRKDISYQSYKTRLNK